MYPVDIFEPRIVENVASETYDPDKITKLYAEDLNNATANIVAEQDTLGLNPQGSFETVAQRLAQMAPPVGLVHSVHYEGLLFGVDDYILTFRALKPETVTVFAHQIKHVQGVVVVVASDQTSLTAIITVNGIDANGEIISDVLAIDQPLHEITFHYTDHAFARITSIIASDVVGANGQYRVGVDDRYGLPNYPLTAQGDVFKVILGALDFTDYDINPDFGTVKINISQSVSDTSLGVIYKLSV